MQKRVLILHGWGGSDSPHWQSYLAAKIAQNYGSVTFLRFDNMHAPKLKRWKEQLKDAFLHYKPHIVVCHSLANTLYFHTIDTLQKEHPKLDALFMVAPVSTNCAIKELGEFFPVTLPNTLHAKHAHLIASTNDPYITIDEAKAIAHTYHIAIDIHHEAGHFNVESGHTNWDYIVQQVGGYL